MKLGFVSAILPELALDEVLAYAAKVGYSCVEVMCWPPGGASRRYAGVMHVDATTLNDKSLASIRQSIDRHGVTISSLGYYPNPLAADPAEAETSTRHLRAVIDASAELGINTVTSFIGRDPSKSVDANWPRMLDTWRPLVEHAESRGVRIGIENCPMYFTNDEWPGGKNLATSPAIWRKLFHDIPNANFGLNFDPSHFVWQQMDYLAPLKEFSSRLVHMHAKDARIDRDALDSHGVLAPPNLWHTPKLPGQGDVRWGAFLGALADTKYEGPITVEVEDRAYEGSLAKRQESLVISHTFLRQFIAG
jgi:sugar phosphate isomerase/epimerase